MKILKWILKNVLGQNSVNQPKSDPKVLPPRLEALEHYRDLKAKNFRNI